MQAVAIDSIDMQLPARPASIGDARRAAGRLLERHGHDSWAVRIAVSEAVTNAVNHAFLDRPRGSIHLTVSLDEDAVHVVIEDDGSGMRPRIDSPGLGLGISIIEAVSERLMLEDVGNEGTRVSMSFALDRSRG